ncbi:MAG: ATP adenylyltransferase [Synechococcus sp.]
MALECYEQEALKRSATALQQGALHPLKTTHRALTDRTGSHQFELRTLVSDLPKHLRQSGPKPNPFLPWDQRLEIGRVGEDHALILNKYPVQLGHMLLITRHWAAQSDWLQQQDWHALCCVDQRTSGLWFFNSGPDAGASQPHRHIQLLPRPNDVTSCPREAWFFKRLGPKQGDDHGSSPLDRAITVRARDLNASNQADHLLGLYREMSLELGLGDPQQPGQPRAPYNLLMTRRWLALVRRINDGSHGFSLNALGFAGYLLATPGADLQWLETYGPDRLLESVVEPFRDSTDDRIT